MENKKILIVDDEHDILTMLSKRLKAEGYSVITADCGKNALITAKSQHIDLVILDVVLPDMEGGEVAAKLNNDHRTKDIPVIFLTALLPKSEEWERKHLIGGNITYSKPYDEVELIEQIEHILYGAVTSK